MNHSVLSGWGIQKVNWRPACVTWQRCAHDGTPCAACLRAGGAGLAQIRRRRLADWHCAVWKNYVPLSESSEDIRVARQATFAVPNTMDDLLFCTALWSNPIFIGKISTLRRWYRREKTASASLSFLPERRAIPLAGRLSQTDRFGAPNSCTKDTISQSSSVRTAGGTRRGFSGRQSA